MTPVALTPGPHEMLQKLATIFAAALVSKEGGLEDSFTAQYFQREFETFTRIAADPIRGRNALEQLIRDTAHLPQRFNRNPQDAILALRETVSRLEVFFLLQNAAAHLNTKADDPITTRIEAAYKQFPTKAAWIIESQAHDLMIALLKAASQDRPFHNPQIPNHTQLYIHAGLGLAAAEYVFFKSSQNPSDENLLKRIKHFLQLCDTYGLSHWRYGAIDALGVFLVVFRTDLVAQAQRLINTQIPEIALHFAHGQGRGLYFHINQTTPFSADQLLARLETLNPTAQHKQAAMTGLAWPLILIHAHSPQQLDRLWLEPHGRTLLQSPGFTLGVQTTALTLARGPQGPAYLDALRNHKGGPWYGPLIREPLTRTLRDHLPRLATDACLADALFHGSIDAYLQSAQK